MITSATGSFMAPIFILFPVGKRRFRRINLAVCQKWLDKRTFYGLVGTFFKFVKPTLEEWILLVIDIYGCHRTLNPFNFWCDSCVVLTIPPHTPHPFQPL
jgi:hypothetical protein